MKMLIQHQSTRSGCVLLMTGTACFLVQALVPNRLGPNGIFHEPLFLTLFGTLLLAAAGVFFVGGFLWRFIQRSR